MVNFRSKLKGTIVQNTTNPIEIYSNLDRQATAGPLRPAQEQVLTNWFDNHRSDKDIIIKLHTGEGKTLIGLLILQSRLNSKNGPCLYICPSKQLAQQVGNDAVKFGVKCIVDQGGDIPLDFIEGKSILVSYVQRVFNGMTKFGLDNAYTKMGTIVLDDSHACIESIRSSFSLRAKRESKTFSFLLSLFESSLRRQGEGSYLDIKNNSSSNILMVVPYWDWIDKKQEVAEFFSENREEEGVKFCYPLLKNIWQNCTAYFTERGVEITPDHNLLHRFTFFTNCDQRILMSATTQDDSFFIKGLGLSAYSILNPLKNQGSLWSGEKMILFPSMINELFSTDNIREFASTPSPKGMVSNVIIVPSFKLAEEYTKLGSHLAYSKNMDDELSYLKSGGYNDHSVVFVNRYDGIDLADNQCRILVLDSLPVMGNLSDRYELSCRDDSDIINRKIAQKIEQGLGRSVRSEKDYSVILINGEDLVRFIKTSSHQKYFSPQTRKQIEIGEEVSDMVKEEQTSDDGRHAFVKVINQCLGRDQLWKQYYKENMDSIQYEGDDHPYLHQVQKEAEAERAYSKANYQEAEGIYQELSNEMINAGRDLEAGWYLQLVAKMAYHTRKLDADKIQRRAHELNNYVLMPASITYKPLHLINQSSLLLIQGYLKKEGSFEDLNLHIKEIVANLSFGKPASKFETALFELGKLLGCVSERPDQRYKVGPDNLWMLPNEWKFLIFECKNEVNLFRQNITKDEVGQMNNHIGWFHQNYKNINDVTFIHIHPTYTFSRQANYTSPVRIMTPTLLEKFKEHIIGFINEFSTYDLNSLSEDYIHSALERNLLSFPLIVKKFTMDAVQQH